MLDMLIKNVEIFDGTGARPIVGNVGILDGKIVTAPGSCGNALVVIDGAGLSLAPGFIDAHTHSDRQLFSNPARDEKLKQGVTTEIGGQCGWSSAPFPKSAPAKYRQYEKTLHNTPDFESYAEYLEYLDKLKLGANQASFVGHQAIRGTVMDMDNRAPTAKELDHMCALAEEAMQSGALGVSSGLVYAPGVYAKVDELIAVAKVAARYGGRYTTHIHNEGDLLVESVADAIRVGEEAGVPVNISHLKALFPENFHKVDIVLDMIDEANARGMDITFDAYPYAACSATILSTLPPSYLSHGIDWLVEHLDGEENIQALRKAIFEPTEVWENYLAKIGVENIMIVGAKVTPDALGLRISEYAEAHGLDGIAAYAQIIRLNRGNVSDIRFAMSEENIEKIYSHPKCMVGSDGLYMGHGALTHVRAFTTFPRYLGHYIRDRKLLSFQEGIRRITGMPADVYGLEGKGYIKEGYDADLVLFNKDQIREKATYADPFIPNEGIRMVIVGGKAAVVENHLTGVLAGKKILRKK